MSLKDKTIVVTGGSRGLGLELVEALVDHGAKVTVVARGTQALEAVASRLGVATIAADVTDEAAAHRIVGDLSPDILVLNAGTTPPMGRLDVRLNQSTHPVRIGSVDVGMFSSVYAKFDGVWLTPAWLEGREVIAVFENRGDPRPSYIMWLTWYDGKISFIRDYRYVRYIVADAELVLAADAGPDDCGFDIDGSKILMEREQQ